MADVIYSSANAVKDKDSLFNIMRLGGFKEAPFYASLLKGKEYDGSIEGGHSFSHRAGPTAGQANAYGEGSRRADITSFPSTTLKNELQTFKKTSGITNTQKASMSEFKIADKLTDQKDLNKRQMLFDIEAAILGANAPTVGVDAGGNRLTTLAGVGHYSTVNDQALAGAFDFAVIEAGFEEQFFAGVTEQKILMVGRNVKKWINAYLAISKQASNGDKKIVNNVTHIDDIGFATNVPIIVNPHLPVDSAMVYAPSLINPVPLRVLKDNDCTDPSYDAYVEEDIHEITLQVLDPKACIIWNNIQPPA